MNRKSSRWEGQTLDELKERWDRPNLHLFSQVDSTNEQARRLADEGAPAGTLVLADAQSKGKGVEGRRWHSPKGMGLYLSLVLRPDSLPNPKLVPLLAGLGIARAAEKLVPEAEVAIKWPNDLIVNDRKAGGVLSEASWDGNVVRHVVVGIGVNVHQEEKDFPPELRPVAISLEAAAGESVSRLDLADLVLQHVEEHCSRLETSVDRVLLRQFDERDWLRDRRCAVRTSPEAEPLHGTAVGIAPDGALLFRPDKGALRRLSSGRVLIEELTMPDF